MHLNQAEHEIPTAIAAAIRSGLEKRILPKHIRKITVELTNVSHNALEFDLDADLAGDVAAWYMDLKESLARSAALCCLENQWRIASPQLVVRDVNAFPP